jgi:prepilin-type N-terminal cleavage/methylation domain-containing protein
MKRNGFTLIELVVVLALLGLLVIASATIAASVPMQMRFRGALIELDADLRWARGEAATRQRNVAVRFTRINGEWGYAIYRDGNGNGVYNDEIAAGIDRLIRPWKKLSGSGRIALPPFAIPDPTGNSSLSPAASPVRWNRSRLCSFSPFGDSTPGSVIVTSGAEIGAVIVSGESGTIRVMRYRQGRGWERYLSP